MTFEEFLSTLSAPSPPKSLTPLLRAMWLTRKGDWDAAHKLASDDASAMAARIHAHLHRVEGDLGNAAYWYRQAHIAVESGTLEKEWESITRALL